MVPCSSTEKHFDNVGLAVDICPDLAAYKAKRTILKFKLTLTWPLTTKNVGNLLPPCASP